MAVVSGAAGRTRHGLPGGRTNAVLSLAAVLRDTPRAAPALSLEEWREVVLDRLRPHRIRALLADRLGAWPEECQPSRHSAISNLHVPAIRYSCEMA
ncbi:MAG: hypothetical protein ABFC38_15330 [Methanospirillum sp.]